MKTSFSWLFTLLVVLSAIAFAHPAHARRVALVIGNGAYEYATRLQNPVNDATDIAAALKRLDFEVIDGRDLGTDMFDAAVQSFANRLKGADIALFYYSGHGLQFDGANYLVPIDARIDSVTALKRRAVVAQDVVDQMERGAAASLVFLDACRNNTLTRELAQSLPEVTRTTAVNRGLARMTGNGNSLVAFAAAPNDVAADGTGQRNSPFSAAVLKHIETPNIVVPEMLTEVTADVVRATNNRQKPEVLSRLVTQVRLKLASLSVPAPQIVIPTPPLPEVNREREASVVWDTLKTTCDRLSLDLFHNRYSDTFFGDLAKARSQQIAARAICIPEQRTPTPSPSEEAAAAQAAAQARAAAETKARAAAAEAARVNAEADAKARTEAAARQKAAEEKARAEAEIARTKAEAEAKSRAEVETARLKSEAEASARTETEARQRAELEAKSRFVSELQAELKRTGCFSSEIDGKWGKDSQAALTRLLQNQGQRVPAEPTAAELQIAKSATDAACKLTEPKAPAATLPPKPSAAVASKTTSSKDGTPSKGESKEAQEPSKPRTRSGQSCIMFAGKCY